MATPEENLATALANLASAIKTATENPKPNYTVDGQSVSWSDYLSGLMSAYEKLQATAAATEGPVEIVTQCFSP